MPDAEGVPVLVKGHGLDVDSGKGYVDTPGVTGPIVSRVSERVVVIDLVEGGVEVVVPLISVGVPSSSMKMKVTENARMPRPPPGPPTASKYARGSHPALTMSARKGFPKRPKPKNQSKMSGSVPGSPRFTMSKF